MHSPPRSPCLCAAVAWLAALATGAAAAEAAPAAAPPLRVDVIPEPRKVVGEGWEFAVDRFCIVLVSERATRGTRRAARAVQLGLRERFGLDAPIVRITEQGRHGVTRPIWVVEPRLKRRPARTIGVKGLTFTDAMRRGGYFIRVDAVEAVLHGADDAGSTHAAQTFLQLVRPPRKGSLFRKSRPPTVPCLWIQDWPSHPVRALPADRALPGDLDAVGRVLDLAARYKLNAIVRGQLPRDPGRAAAVRALAVARAIRIVDSAPPPPDTRPRLESRPAAADDLRETLAALGEWMWGPPDPDAETFRRRFDRDVAAYPTPQPAPPAPPRPDPLADDEAE